VERRQALLEEELRWWTTELPVWNGRWITPDGAPPPAFTYQSDASGYGAGLRLKRATSAPSQHEDMQFYWRGAERAQSINYKELATPVHALAVLDRKCPIRGGPGGAIIEGELDNTTAVSMLNKQGGRTPRLSLVAERFWRWLLKRGLFHRVHHLSGELNTVADKISRDRGDRSQWRLSDEAWAEVQKAFGPHTIDLFATRHNTLLPRYFARFLDQEAAAEDALAQDWSEEHNPYAHPPFGLLPLVLRKVRRDQVKALTLVTPVWPAQHWLPDLMSMSVPPPTILTADPLLTPHLPSRWRPSQPPWSTAVWRISGCASQQKVELQQQWSRLWKPGRTHGA